MDIIFEISLTWIVIFIVTGFIAGYVDAIAGGGGMIQLPILLLGGVPPIFALATNKIVSMFGTLVAIVGYHRHKMILWRYVAIAVVPCLIASYYGGLLALQTSSWILQWLIILCIPIALYFTLQNKTETLSKCERGVSKTLLTTVPIGFYDGYLGPGTGSYMTIALHKYMKIDYLHATAITKPLNLSTNVGAAIAFLLAGKVIWIVAIPMLLANALGAAIGSHYAVKGGVEFIKKVLISVLAMMLLANIVKILFF
ncbi:Transmembrane protein YfcA [hydrothermal vent metagenome]|uniref:Transmembrane protein YfcA n=1 Tax=hydrothermal vent metagenome TaxID=652676 RepID=A0A3B0Y3R3_9ZZZZ